METVEVIIIGSGPAGYAAALYAARAQLKPLVLAGEKGGGQLMLTTQVENYPGFKDGVMGPDLMAVMRQQAEKFGAVMKDQNVDKVDFSRQPLTVVSGEIEYQGEAVILTTGAESIPLGVPGESDYIGRGVSYCAVCDAPFFKDKRVVVVGGGDAAVEDTLALTKFTAKISLIHRRDQFRASKIMQARVLGQKDKVEVLWESQVVKVTGDEKHVTSVTVKNIKTGQVQEIPAQGLFVAIGHRPATEFLKGQVALDEKDYVKTSINYPEGQSWLKGYPTMTSVPGVFAGGDNVDFRYRQAVTAAGMGVMAALDAEKWLEGL
ncbi:thioredoxin-disulfide reductase [Microgenomates group bacterium RBG_16_45_19]|nr:MAG: thioredoxin-disulfide reductase [Microgenomates group bacterium RBG_16_45_19]